MVSVNGADSNLRYERHGKNVRIYNPNTPKNSIGSAGSLVSFDSKAEADAFVKQHTPEEKPSMSAEEVRRHMALSMVPGYGFFEVMTPEYKEAAKALLYYRERGLA